MILDPFSREHDYTTFLKKREILKTEHEQFLVAQEAGRKMITDALFDKQKIPTLVPNLDKEKSRNPP